MSQHSQFDLLRERRFAPLAQLDEEFQEYARELTRRFGPDLDWENYDLSAVINAVPLDQKLHHQ